MIKSSVTRIIKKHQSSSFENQYFYDVETYKYDPFTILYLKIHDTFDSSLILFNGVQSIKNQPGISKEIMLLYFLIYNYTGDVRLLLWLSEIHTDILTGLFIYFFILKMKLRNR